MRVLVATDGSDTAAAAVRFAAGFPFPPGSAVKVVSVLGTVFHEREYAVLTVEQQEAYQQRKSGTFDEVEELVTSEAAVFAQTDWVITTETRSGHPAAEIVAAAEDHEADLIVVGSHGLTGFKRFLLGSVSHQVLQSARQSVLVVRKPEEDCDGVQPEPPALNGHPWSFLVCYDGSDSSDRAIDFCAELELGEVSSIEVLTVLPMVRLFRQDIRQELNWIWQQKKETEKAELEAAAARLRGRAGEVATSLVEAADVSDAILAAGDDINSDVIVLGHKGKGAIERFLIGSVTPRVAQHACRSVLAVR